MQPWASCRPLLPPEPSGSWAAWRVSGGKRGHYCRVWPIGGAALGWLLIWPERISSGAGLNNRRVRLALAVLGWTLSAILFALVGLALNLYARYMLFALPVVALCGGLLLSRISAARTGRVAGRRSAAGPVRRASPGALGSGLTICMSRG